jgi:hypothetical protein
MSLELVQQVTLGIAAFLFLGTATIGFKWVSSSYLLGYVLAGVGFFCVSLLAGEVAAT